YISHITYMPFGCVGSCMRIVGRIKMSTSRTRIGCAAIAELMDMKPMIARSQAGDLRPTPYAIGLVGQGNRTADSTASGGKKHRHGFQGRRRLFHRRLGPCGEGADD